MVSCFEQNEDERSSELLCRVGLSHEPGLGSYNGGQRKLYPTRRHLRRRPHHHQSKGARCGGVRGADIEVHQPSSDTTPSESWNPAESVAGENLTFLIFSVCASGSSAASAMWCTLTQTWAFAVTFVSCFMERPMVEHEQAVLHARLRSSLHQGAVILPVTLIQAREHEWKPTLLRQLLSHLVVDQISITRANMNSPNLCDNDAPFPSVWHSSRTTEFSPCLIRCCCTNEFQFAFCRRHLVSTTDLAHLQQG